MKSLVPFFAVASLAALSCISLAAPPKKASPKTAAPASFEATLKKTGLKYTLDDDKDFKIIFEFTNDKRSQVVFIGGKSSVIGPDGEKVKMRKVFSACWSQPEMFPEKKLAEALGEVPLVGAWRLSKSGDDNILLLSLDIPEDISARSLKQVIFAMAEAADEKEKALTEGKDDL